MSKIKLTFSDKEKIIHYLMERVKQSEGKPIAIAISDGAGVLISLTLMEGMATRGGEFATHKAYTAAKFQKSTWEMVKHLDKQGVPMSAFCDPRLSPLKGGAPIKNEDGDTIGAVGISGWTGEEDQMLADEAAAQIC